MLQNEKLARLEDAIAEYGREQAPLGRTYSKAVNLGVNAVHIALIAQPDTNRNGWQLIDTPFYESQQDRAGEFFGSRAIYLSTNPGEILRVLSVPHDTYPAVPSVAAIQPITIPDLLTEDPSVGRSIIQATQQHIKMFNLRIQ